MAFPTRRSAFCALGLGVSHGGEQRRIHHWLTLESSGHSVFAQLQGAGGRGGCCGLADVFRGDGPVIIDGH